VLACGSDCRVGGERRVTGLDPVLDVRDLAVHFTPRAGWFGRPRPAVKAVDGVDLTIARRSTRCAATSKWSSKTQRCRLIREPR
jgi:ABC-type microcin C transport system duplicated ATPase subunit YejF